LGNDTFQNMEDWGAMDEAAKIPDRAKDADKMICFLACFLIIRLLGGGSKGDLPETRDPRPGPLGPCPGPLGPCPGPLGPCPGPLGFCPGPLVLWCGGTHAGGRR
jgi:hypothetical protein